MKVESERDWYQKSTKTQNTLKADNNVERKINKEVNWEASKPFTLLDGWKTKMLWSAHSWNTNFNRAIE